MRACNPMAGLPDSGLRSLQGVATNIFPMDVAKEPKLALMLTKKEMVHVQVYSWRGLDVDCTAHRTTRPPTHRTTHRTTVPPSVPPNVPPNVPCTVPPVHHTLNGVVFDWA